MRNLIGLLTTWWVICYGAFAQETLTLNDAINQAIQNNYSIQIAKNNSQIARNNATIGNAGMLPQVTLGASYDFSNSNVRQRFATGTEIDKNNANSNAYGVGASLGWTFFDGFRMFATYDKLKTLGEIGELDLREQANNTIADVIRTYYDVVRQQQFIKVTETSIDIAQQRVNISKAKYELGAAPRLDYTQSQIDFNNSKSSLAEQQLALERAKINLNRLLSRPSTTEINITDSMRVDSSRLMYNDLVARNNVSILRSQKFVEVGKNNVRIAQSGYFPELRLNLNYNFSNANNSTGLLLYNQSLGFNAGVTASFNLFNGFNQHRLVNNEKLSLSNYEIQFEATKLDVDADLLIAYKSFETKLNVLRMQEESYKMARENIDVALERYKLGAINILDLRQLQLAYDESGNDLVNARYDTKLAEIELLRLSDSLPSR